MATSIDDLLTALDHETALRQLEAAQCMQAVSVTGRMLNRLRADGVGTPISRDDVTRRLADACAEAALTFACGPGRLADLFGVTSDAVGRFLYDLSAADRWAVATRLAPLTRRLGRHVAASGPYSNVPQLLGLVDRSRELIAIAARWPADPDHLGGLQIPIPAVVASAERQPTRAVTESMARLVAEFHRPGRQPMTIRQMIAVTHAAEAVNSAAVQLAPGRPTPAADGAEPAQQPWRQVREYLSRITDESRRRPEPNDSTLNNALQVHAAAWRVLSSGAPYPNTALQGTEVRTLDQAVAMVPMLAAGLERDLRAPVQRFVTGGPRPLHEQRAMEWLLHQPFLVREPDLRPAIAILCEAVRESHALRAAPDPAGIMLRPVHELQPDAAIRI